MHSFKDRMASAVDDPGKQGWLVSILELGAWFGVLVTGELSVTNHSSPTGSWPPQAYFADRFSRRYTIVLGVSFSHPYAPEYSIMHWQLLACFVLESLFRPPLRDRRLSMEVNNRLSMFPHCWPDSQVDLSRVWVLVHSAWLFHSTMPRLLLPRCEEVSLLFNRLLSHSASWYLSGSIMVSHLVYEAQGTNITVHWKGANFIGGSGAGQHEAAWRLPLALQLVPAVILGVGILFMPFSPRWVLRI